MWGQRGGGGGWGGEGWGCDIGTTFISVRDHKVHCINSPTIFSTVRAASCMLATTKKSNLPFAFNTAVNYIYVDNLEREKYKKTNQERELLTHWRQTCPCPLEDIRERKKSPVPDFKFWVLCANKKTSDVLFLSVHVNHRYLRLRGDNHSTKNLGKSIAENECFIKRREYLNDISGNQKHACWADYFNETRRAFLRSPETFRADFGRDNSHCIL